MEMILVAGVLYLGIIAGCNLQFLPILILTLLSILIFLYLLKNYQEIMGLITVGFGLLSLLFNLSMWIAYYISSDQNWIQNIFKEYILR